MIQVQNQPTVYLGLSGGVDSAVAGHLLKNQGYAVVGVFMKNFTLPLDSGYACWEPEWRDAVRVAAHLGVPIVRWDFEELYRREVFAAAAAALSAGQTPNPDVLCNKYVKFGAFYEAARAAGANYIATGHYARVGTNPARLLKAVDENKDQTYFLNNIPAEALAHTLFPIGHLPKSEVRDLARLAGIPVAEKKDSTGVCFVGEVPLRELFGDLVASARGDVVLTDGTVVGEHDGLPWYTIGQRHGFGGGGGQPFYILAKNLETNQLVVGYENDPLLFTTGILVENFYWINRPAPGEKLWVRLRHRQPLQAVASVAEKNDGALIITTAEPQRAVTPGQFAALYSGEECFGGGVVASNL